jgi:hypothetical protein
MVANMYRLMTEDANSCYWVDFPNSRKTKLCNVAEQVMIAWPVNGGNLQGFINVHVQFMGETRGSFSAANMVDSITKLFKESASNGFAQAQGWPADKLEVKLTAQDAKCFRVDGTDYLRDAPWKEPNPKD